MNKVEKKWSPAARLAALKSRREHKKHPAPAGPSMYDQILEARKNKVLTPKERKAEKLARYKRKLERAGGDARIIPPGPQRALGPGNKSDKILEPKKRTAVSKKRELSNKKSSGKEIVGHHGHHAHGKSVLWPAMYEHLRGKGFSKEKAARISNAAWDKKHGKNKPSVGKVVKSSPDSSEVHVNAPMGSKKPCSKYKHNKNSSKCENCGKGFVAHKAEIRKAWSEAARKAALAARREHAKQKGGKSKWRNAPGDKDALVRDHDGTGINNGTTSFVKQLPKKKNGDGKNFRATTYFEDGTSKVSHHSTPEAAMNAAHTKEKMTLHPREKSSTVGGKKTAKKPKQLTPSQKASDANHSAPVKDSGGKVLSGQAAVDQTLPKQYQGQSPELQIKYLRNKAVRAQNHAKQIRDLARRHGGDFDTPQDRADAKSEDITAKTALNAILHINRNNPRGKKLSPRLDQDFK